MKSDRKLKIRYRAENGINALTRTFTSILISRAMTEISESLILTPRSEKILELIKLVDAQLSTSALPEIGQVRHEN
jgi:hypothetical protein